MLGAWLMLSRSFLSLDLVISSATMTCTGLCRLCVTFVNGLLRVSHLGVMFRFFANFSLINCVVVRFSGLVSLINWVNSISS